MTSPLPIYNSGVPLGTDLPSENQTDFFDNFSLLNQFFGADHIPFGNTISNITNANPAVITSVSHGLSSGNSITPTHISGFIDGVPTLWPLNGSPYVITVIDANTFSIPVDTTNLALNPPYTANTGDYTSASIPYGYHKQNTFPDPLNTDPNLVSPTGSYYTKQFQNLSQLFFQNGNSASNVSMLTGLNPITGSPGGAFRTPWGLTINFGTFAIKSSPQTFNYAIPYTSKVYSLYGNYYGLPNKNFRYQLNAISNTQFTVQGGDFTQGGKPFYFFAIGN